MSRNPNRRVRRSERSLISKAARRASTVAVKETTALQLPIQIVRRHKVVLLNRQGADREIKSVHQVKSLIDLNKGTKIWLQPKD